MDEFSKWLHINISQSDQIYACGLGSLMKKSEYLSLHGLIDVSNIVHDLDKDGFPNLQSLRLTKLKSLESISCPGNKLPGGSFNELRKVDVWRCGRLKNLFPLCVAKLLHHITIGKCERMEEIIVREDDDEVGHNIDDDNHFSLQLRYLKLYDLPNLVQFCYSKQTTTGESSSLLIDHSKPFFNERVSFSKLEELTMWDMNMEKLWPEKLMVSRSAYMPNLTSLEVTGCNNLKYLFTFSLAQKFVNLKSIRVEYCEAMEDIIRVVKLGEEETQTERIDLFPKLESVRLVDLSSLQRFCIATDSSSCMVFPLLSNLKIEDCPELKTFVSAPTTIPKQASVDHPVSTQSFFNIKVSFPHLEELYLMKSSAITLWPNTTLSSLHLQNLIGLEVQCCNRVKYLFSFGMAERLVNLEMLKIDDCVAMEGILKSRKVVVGEERSSIENNTTLFPKLQTLKLKSLQVLKTFCWEDSSLGDGDGDGDVDDEKIVPKQHFFNGMIAFFNLKELIVEDCKNLKYLLSSAMAQSLVQLEKLEVNECENMEEVIVSSTHHNEESPSGSFKAITFEKLESLHLWKLPNLKRFCEGDGIECPMLSKLVVLGCLKLKEFMGGEKEIVSSAQQSLFKHNNKVIFPMLEELETDWSEVIKEVFEMSSNSNSIILFPNLSKLLLTCKSPDEAIGVPNLKLFLHKYHKIHTLELSGSFVNLSSGGNGDGETTCDFINNNTTPTSSSLERLNITRADMLDYVFGVESYHTHNNNIVLFPNLTHVSVERCSRLQSFAPSFMCFPNLECLYVWKCHGLRYLFSSATAAALLQLKKMTITHCEGMRNIIINNHDHDRDQKLLSQVDEAEEEHSTDHCLVFQNLKHLLLTELPSLQSFYSGNKVISFPNLEQLYMSKCPEMRRFSNRIINTSASLLKTIKVDGNQEIIETDVNTTTTKLFEEDDSDFDQLLAHQTVSFSKLEKLSMWEMNIEKLWPVQLVSSSSYPYMQNLTSLEVNRCDSLKYLFTFSLAQKFVNLKSIRVQDCKAMEDIIRVVELGEEESTHDLFPKLRSLNLVKLSALQTICTATESSSCMVFPLLSKLKVEDCPEIKTFVSSPTTIPTQVSFDRREVNQLLSIQPFSTEKIAFPNLKKLTVTRCNNLKYLLSSTMARQLERLTVKECAKIEGVLVSDEEYSSSGGVEYPLLSRMIILDCPKLKVFMGGGSRSRRTSSSCTTNNNIIIGEEMEMVSNPKQSFFKYNKKVIFPMLEELETDWSEGIKEIFEMSSSSNSILLFPNLSTLVLTCKSPDEAIGVPNLKLFLHKYHKIHRLELRGSFVNLSSGGNGNSNGELINNSTTHLTPTPSSSLKQLCIRDVDMVDDVFGVEPSHNTIIVLFPNLKHVRVERCSRLHRFAPFFMSFPNLVSLFVSECHGLRYLFSSSTAANLLQLKYMTIKNCNEMREIIINHNGHDHNNEEEESTHHHSLVFQFLWELQLENLPNLKSFYSGNKIISFPNLERIHLRNCPKIRRFSDGIVNTTASLLKTIKVDGKQEILDGDVNTTISKLFREDNNIS